MTRSLLIRGMIAGLIAGLLVFAAGRVFGEPQVDRAIAFEAAMDEASAKAEAAAGHAAALPEPEPVSRANQAGLGLFTGTVIYSAAFGGLFALVFAFAHGRVGTADARLVSLLLAAGAFLAVFLVPDLKYPSNPPAVGLPETIGIRTELYFVMMACSIGALVAAAAMRQRLLPGRGAWSASLLAAGFYAAVMAVVMLLLPAVQEVPDGFDAVVLWRFRVASIAMQFVMWATLGLVFGALAERVIVGRRGAPAGGRLRAATR
jgi:predicted cobalt transporter CbtA